MGNVVWKGDYVCAACGHRAAAEITGSPSIDYSDPARVDRLVKITMGLVPCPKCAASDPAATRQARNSVLGMIGGYLVASVIGTFVMSRIFGKLIAGILVFVLFCLFCFLLVKNLGAKGAASKRLRFV